MSIESRGYTSERKQAVIKSDAIHYLEATVSLLGITGSRKIFPRNIVVALDQAYTSAYGDSFNSTVGFCPLPGDANAGKVFVRDTGDVTQMQVTAVHELWHFLGTYDGYKYLRNPLFVRHGYLVRSGSTHAAYFAFANEMVTQHATRIAFSLPHVDFGTKLPIQQQAIEEAQATIDSGMIDPEGFMDIVVKQIALKMGRPTEDVWKRLVIGMVSKDAGFIAQQLGEEGLMMLGLYRFRGNRSFIEYARDMPTRDLLIMKYFRTNDPRTKQKLVRKIIQALPERYQQEAISLGQIASDMFAPVVHSN